MRSTDLEIYRCLFRFVSELRRVTMVITKQRLGRGLFCSLFCLSGDDKANEHCRGCHKRHDEPGGRLASNSQLARMQIDRRTELTMAAETAPSEGGTEQFDFGNRSLLGGEGHVAEVGPEHFSLGAELHALIHAVVASIVVAGECFAVVILVMIALVVVGASIIVAQVARATFPKKNTVSFRECQQQKGRTQPKTNTW